MPRLVVSLFGSADAVECTFVFFSAGHKQTWKVLLTPRISAAWWIDENTSYLPTIPSGRLVAARIAGYRADRHGAR